jgi:hypothetical protein
VVALAASLGLVAVAISLAAFLYLPHDGSDRASEGQESQPVEDAAEQCLESVARFQKQLESASDIEAVVLKRERIAGVLQPLIETQIKQRRDPLSFFWKTVKPEPGAEMIYQANANDGQILLRVAGPIGELVPTLRVDTDSPMLWTLTNHKFHDLSLWRMNRRMLDDVRRATGQEDTEVSLERNTIHDGRAYDRYYIRIADRHSQEFSYKLMVVWVDSTSGRPVRRELYDWSDPPALLELFEIRDVRYDVGLTDRDFDPKNPAYLFVD